MGFVAGDILEITYNHSVLGSGTLYCQAGEDGSLDAGGYRSSDDSALVAGDGQMIDVITRVRGSFEMPIAWDMVDKDELDKLGDLAGSPVLADWTINHIGGTIWGGLGKPVGGLVGSTGKATIPLKLAFGGKLKRIS